MRKRLVREGLFYLTFEYSFRSYDKNRVLDNDIYNQFDRIEKNFLESTYPKIENNKHLIDECISKNLKGWTVDRLYRIDLAILRVSVYEIIIEKVTPKEIIANEAVELAKKYGTKNSSSLINGVLGTIIRSEEIA